MLSASLPTLTAPSKGQCRGFGSLGRTCTRRQVVETGLPVIVLLGGRVSEPLSALSRSTGAADLFQSPRNSAIHSLLPPEGGGEDLLSDDGRAASSSRVRIPICVSSLHSGGEHSDCRSAVVLRVGIRNWRPPSSWSPGSLAGVPVPISQMTVERVFSQRPVSINSATGFVRHMIGRAAGSNTDPLGRRLRDGSLGWRSWRIRGRSGDLSRPPDYAGSLCAREGHSRSADVRPSSERTGSVRIGEMRST